MPNVLGKAQKTGLHLVGASVLIEMYFDDEYKASVAFEEACAALKAGDKIELSCSGFSRVDSEDA